MAIFSYTTKKLIKSPMNFVVFILSILALILFYYLISYLSKNDIDKKTQEAIDHNINLDWYILYKSHFWKGWQLGIMALFISVFIFIFISLNTVKILRDEIDEGTLLILVSKPLTRKRIWIEKVLSLQLVVITFIFSALLFSSFFMFMPILGGKWAFFTFFPFFFYAFGLIVIIELFVSSISFLISLFFRGIVVGSIVVGMGFFFIISNQVIDGMITSKISPNFLLVSRAAHTMNTIYNNVPEKTRENLKNFGIESSSQTITMFKTMYQDYIFENQDQNFPQYYSSRQEQEIVAKIAQNSNNWKQDYPSLEKYEDLIIDIYYIGNVLRSNQNLSYLQMLFDFDLGQIENKHQHNLTGKVIVNFDYHLSDAIGTLKANSFSEEEYLTFKSSVTRLFYLRRINIFYQLSYIWDGFFNNQYQNNLLSSPWPLDFFQPWIKDFHLIDLVKDSSNKYRIDIEKAEFKNVGSKILDWRTITITYSILGFVIFGLSFYVFLRKDFI